jgi:heme-degrading monooxygenase HmoA
MPIQVIIKRKWQVDKPEALLPLLPELRALAQNQSGYISGETLKSLDAPDMYMVFSRWKTVDDWNEWFSSKKRREIQGKVDSLIGEKTFYEVFETMGL